MKDIKDYKQLSIQDTLNSLTPHNQKIIQEFLKKCRISACDSSMVKITNKIVVIADTIQKDLDKLTLEDVTDFLVLLNKSPKAIATKNDIKKILKRFLKWKYPNWSLKFNELGDIKLNTKNADRHLTKQDLLTPEEMKAIINATDSLRYKTILLMLQETACRPEELCKITWGDIDFNNPEIKLHSSKTSETRTIPLNESIKHLERYRTECFSEVPRKTDFIFSNQKEKHISTQALSEYLLKIERKLDFKKHLYPYLWRHSILSVMIKKLSPKVYEMYAGHSLETGMKTYAHLDNDDLKKELFSKVYDIKEISSKDKSKMKELEKQNESLRKEFETMKIQIEQLSKQFLSDYQRHIKDRQEMDKKEEAILMKIKSKR
jgi:integrase